MTSLRNFTCFACLDRLGLDTSLWSIHRLFTQLKPFANLIPWNCKQTVRESGNVTFFKIVQISYLNKKGIF